MLQFSAWKYRPSLVWPSVRHNSRPKSSGGRRWLLISYQPKGTKLKNTARHTAKKNYIGNWPDSTYLETRRKIPFPDRQFGRKMWSNSTSMILLYQLLFRLGTPLFLSSHFLGTVSSILSLVGEKSALFPIWHRHLSQRQSVVIIPY